MHHMTHGVRKSADISGIATLGQGVGVGDECVVHVGRRHRWIASTYQCREELDRPWARHACDIHSAFNGSRPHGGRQARHHAGVDL